MINYHQYFCGIVAAGDEGHCISDVIPVFLWDFIVYQFGYGLKAIEIYKGQKYEKVKLRSVDEFMEEE